MHGQLQSDLKFKNDELSLMKSCFNEFTLATAEVDSNDEAAVEQAKRDSLISMMDTAKVI